MRLQIFIIKQITTKHKTRYTLRPGWLAAAKTVIKLGPTKTTRNGLRHPNQGRTTGYGARSTGSRTFSTSHSFPPEHSQQHYKTYEKIAISNGCADFHANIRSARRGASGLRSVPPRRRSAGGSRTMGFSPPLNNHDSVSRSSFRKRNTVQFEP